MTAKDERRTELPEWARFIAIDSDGAAMAFEAPPYLRYWSGGWYWYHAKDTRSIGLSKNRGSFPLSAETAQRLVFSLPAPEPFGATVDRRGVKATDAEVLPVKGIIGGEG